MFHFFQKKMLKKIRNKGTINVLQGGGGQRSMVKDHTFTTTKKLDPSLRYFASYMGIAGCLARCLSSEIMDSLNNFLLLGA